MKLTTDFSNSCILCSAYLTFVTLVISVSSIQAQECGKSSGFSSEWRSDSKRIAGGFTAGPGQFPSYVRLKLKKGGFWSVSYMLCGGSLIDDQHLLTAAHCVENRPQYIEVFDFYGNKLADGKKYCQSSDYVNRIPHSRAAVVNDIAIIKLSVKVTFSDTLQPACLADREIGYSEQAFAAGMGMTEYGQIPRQLLGLAVKREYCGVWDRDSSVICFKSNKARGQTCVGDSGGPVLANFDGKQTVVGATSYGPSRCTDDYSSTIMYANVYNLRDEIDRLRGQCQ